MKFILLPGLDGTGDLFEPLLEELNDVGSVEVISYPTDKALNYSELHELVSLQLPKNENYVLLGESFSGPIAISIAAESPRDLVGLVLCCSFSKIPNKLLPALHPVISLFPVNLVPNKFLSFALLGKWSTPFLESKLRTAIKKVKHHVLSQRLKLIESLNSGSNVQAIKIPILYLAANNDRLVPIRNAMEIKNNNSNVTVEHLDGPHALLQTRPKKSALLISEFVRKIEEKL